jgi:hypothetical protein
MTQTNIDELDTHIDVIKKDLNDFFGEQVFSFMNEMLEVGRMPSLPTTYLSGKTEEQVNHERLINSLFVHSLISEDQYNMKGQSIYRLTDLGYLYCLRTPEIWNRKRQFKIDEHSLIVLNPNDYDQNENVYSIVGSQDGELLLLDWGYEPFNAVGERIYHPKRLTGAQNLPSPLSPDHHPILL